MRTFLVLFFSLSAFNVAVANEQISSVPAFFSVKPIATMQCLGIAESDEVDGARALQWGCGDIDDQRWIIESVGNGQYKFVVRHSGKCLDVPNWSAIDGEALIQYTCHGGENQLFELVMQDVSTFKIKNVHSHMCLDVEANSPYMGALIVQKPCANTPWLHDQIWVIEEAK